MEFLDVLKENNEESLKKYLIQYGKSPKPRAPFYFLKKEEPNVSRSTVNDGTNETDPGNYCEAEVSE
jgi:hypothetical protein